MLNGEKDFFENKMGEDLFEDFYSKFKMGRARSYVNDICFNQKINTLSIFLRQD